MGSFGGRQAGRHSAGAVAESLHFETTQEAVAQTFETFKAYPPVIHLLQQGYNMSQWEPFSFKPPWLHS